MMLVKPGLNLVLPLGALCAAVFLAGAPARAQNPTSAANPYYGSITAQPLTDQTLNLSLDDAVTRGL
jgi:hypothetical protein